MARAPIRLVHASDLHLERPPFGLDVVPKHLRELFVEAPYHAAEQIFETVLSEGADALLLAGDVADVAHAGPPAIVFLIEQFSRLADRGIPVYWAGGKVDPPDEWPPSARLPDNVHIFPVGTVADYELRRNSETIARIQGTSAREGSMASSTGFHRDAHGLYTVGVAYGTDASEGKEGDRLHYMALGGRHQRVTVDKEPGIAHYCGSPQGRGPRELGPHGCTLIHVSETGQAKLQFVATDTIRWVEETIEITATTRSEQLLKRLEERLDKLQAQHRGVELLVQWRVRGAGPLVHRLRTGGMGSEILDTLRRRYGERSPSAWSASLVSESPLSVPAEWYDQETVMGDLLREFRFYSEDDTAPLDLAQFLPAELRDDPLAAIAKLDALDERKQLISDAAKLGIDLIDVPLDEAQPDVAPSAVA
jgi:DNA repair exonuclease SbcCD nuclease subunit